MDQYKKFFCQRFFVLYQRDMMLVSQYFDYPQNVNESFQFNDFWHQISSEYYCGFTKIKPINVVLCSTLKIFFSNHNRD